MFENKKFFFFNLAKNVAKKIKRTICVPLFALIDAHVNSRNGHKMEI